MYGAQYNNLVNNKHKSNGSNNNGKNMTAATAVSVSKPKVPSASSIVKPQSDSSKAETTTTSTNATSAFLVEEELSCMQDFDKNSIPNALPPKNNNNTIATNNANKNNQTGDEALKQANPMLARIASMIQLPLVEPDDESNGDSVKVQSIYTSSDIANIHKHQYNTPNDSAIMHESLELENDDVSDLATSCVNYSCSIATAPCSTVAIPPDSQLKSTIVPKNNTSSTVKHVNIVEPMRIIVPSRTSTIVNKLKTKTPLSKASATTPVVTAEMTSVNLRESTITSPSHPPLAVTSAKTPTSTTLPRVQELQVSTIGEYTAHTLALQVYHEIRRHYNFPETMYNGWTLKTRRECQRLILLIDKTCVVVPRNEEVTKAASMMSDTGNTKEPSKEVANALPPPLLFRTWNVNQIMDDLTLANEFQISVKYVQNQLKIMGIFTDNILSISTATYAEIVKMTNRTSLVDPHEQQRQVKTVDKKRRGGIHNTQYYVTTNRDNGKDLEDMIDERSDMTDDGNCIEVMFSCFKRHYILVFVLIILLCFLVMIFIAGIAVFVIVNVLK